MFHVFFLLIVCTALAYIYGAGTIETIVVENGQRVTVQKKSLLACIAFVALALTLILYAGLRSEVNDTLVYASGFEKISPSISGLDWSLGNNPLFLVYEAILKRYVSSSPKVFFLITACFIELSYLFFIKKYSVNFGLSIYLLISFTLYAFTMAALKQSIAIAIAVWSVPHILEKKYIRALLLIGIATLFHAFSFLFLVAFIMWKSIWDKRAALIIVGTIIVGIFFSSFVGQALDFTNSIGGNVYTNEDFSTGTSVFRIIVYLIPSIMSFVYRGKLREVNSPFLNISVNLSLVAACFMVLAGIGGANLTGRLAGYFDIFICFLIPGILKYGIEEKQTRDIITMVVFIAFAIFYYSYYQKFANAYPGFFTDYYHHTSLSDVLTSW